MGATDAGGTARAARETANEGGAVGEVGRSLRRDAVEKQTNKTRNGIVLNVFLLLPNYPPWRVRDPLGNKHAGKDGNRETRGGRRASREEDEGGTPSGSGEGVRRRGVSGGVTRRAEKRVQGRNPEGAMEEGTAGRSPERKEAALRYWLQMVAFTRAVAG